MYRKLLLSIAATLGLAGAGLAGQKVRADYVIVQPPPGQGRLWVWGPGDTTTAYRYAASWSGPGWRVAVTPYNPYNRPQRPFSMNPAPGFRGPRHAGY